MAALTVLATDSTLETFEKDTRDFESIFSSVRVSGVECEKTTTEMFRYDDEDKEHKTTMLKYQMNTIVAV